jgi:antitoxin (DNA-binding transcriptional repressor) of toxin-antitoxin stability system
MRKITMTEFRSGPGDYILDVCRDGKTFMLTKAGKPVAKLGPIEEGTCEIMPDGTVRGDQDAFRRVVATRALREGWLLTWASTG